MFLFVRHVDRGRVNLFFGGRDKWMTPNNVGLCHCKMLVCHYQSTFLTLYHQHSITFQTRRTIPLMQLHGVQSLRNYDVTGFVKVSCQNKESHFIMYNEPEDKLM